MNKKGKYSVTYQVKFTKNKIFKDTNDLLITNGNSLSQYIY